MLSAEIKDFHAIIDNKPFFDQPGKNKQEAYGNVIEVLRNNGYAKRNLLHYSHHQSYYELIGIDLSRQTKTSIPQQIDFVGKLEGEDCAAKIFIAEKQ